MFPNFDDFFFFFCLIPPARTSSTLLYWSDKRRQPSLVLNLRGRALGLLSLGMKLAVGICRCSLSDWGSSLLFVVWWMLLALRSIEFCQMLFLCLLRWSCGFFPLFINTAYYIDWFLEVKPTLHSWDKSLLFMVYNLFISFWRGPVLFLQLQVHLIGPSFSSKQTSCGGAGSHHWSETLGNGKC